MLNKTVKETHLIAVVIPGSHKLGTAITEKLQNYKELKELARTWQLNAVYTVPLELSTKYIIPEKLRDGLKLLHLRSGLYYSQAETVLLNTGRTVRQILSK
jgi:hypothetical protein